MDFDGQEPVGPGSWCLLSWTVGLTLPGPYKPTGGGTLGDYVAHLSATAPTSVTIAVPDGGLFMGSGACEALAPGAYSSGTSLEPCLATYTSTEDVASKERARSVGVGGGLIQGLSCGHGAPDHASSCTIKFSAVAANDTPFEPWYISALSYYNGNVVSAGEFAIELVWPVSSATTTTTTSGTSLAVSVTTPGLAGPVAVGQPVAVSATVTALGGPVSSISLSDGSTSPDVSLVGAKVPPPFSLAVGTSKSFAFDVSASKPGTATLDLVADGTSSSGAPVEGSGLTKFKVGTGALSITFATTPAIVKLSVDDKGAITAQPVTVAVTFKNLSKKAKLTGVQLIGLAPEPQDKTLALAKLGLAPGTLPVTITTKTKAAGTIAPGASVTTKFTLKVTGDGAYQWRALALYRDPAAPGGNGRAAGLGGPFTATVPPLYFSAQTDPASVLARGGANWVKGGATWFISGEVKNESAYKDLCVAPLMPSFTGNAAGVGPHDITVAGNTQLAPPYAGELRPGQSVDLSMFVNTSADGSTRGSVDLNPQAGVLAPGGQCTAATIGAMTMLAAGDTTMAKGSTDQVVHVDTSVPVAPPSSLPVNAVYFYGAYASHFWSNVAGKLFSLVASARDAVSFQNFYDNLLLHSPPVAAARTALEEYQALVVATDVLANYWRTASPAEQTNVLTQVASVLRREGGDFWKATKGTVEDAAKDWLAQTESVYATGDDRQIYAFWGGTTGDVVAEVATNLAIGELSTRLVDTAPALVRTFERAAGESVVIKALRDMPPGKILNFTEMQTLWGLSKDDLAAFAKIANDEDVLIGVRGRAPISVQNLEEGAVWKHENLKPKNVNPIDIEYLGFPSTSNGLVQFRTYTFEEEHYIFQKIRAARLSAADYKIVMDRFETRLGEVKYLKTIEGFAKSGEINVGFNYADNGIQQATTRQIRKFALESQEVAGGTLYTPYQENLSLYSLRKGGTLPSWCERGLGSVLCRVTGDMDGVYITTTAGGAVDQSKLVRIYEALQAVGWQHPETLTWINDAGEFLFGAKAKILAGLELGGEPMIQFAPNFKQYATYLDLAKSKLISSTNYYLDIVGGYTDLAP